jgi:hypothetical protein
MPSWSTTRAASFPSCRSQRNSGLEGAQAFQDSLKGLGWILALAIFVIYVVLGILYESCSQGCPQPASARSSR